jgi:hypothetical protein
MKPSKERERMRDPGIALSVNCFGFLTAWVVR